MPHPSGFTLHHLDRKVHNRKAFTCGEAGLDDYIRQQSGQDAKRFGATVYVLTPSDDVTRIAGYFTLSGASAGLNNVPQEYRKALPHYADIPALLIGRLAVDQQYQGQKLGKRLLQEAMVKAVQAAETAASALLVVDPLHDEAAAFYAKYGFEKFAGLDRMFIAMSDVIKTLAQLRGHA